MGTPHLSPEDALVDQTRGLLKEVEQTSSCSSQSLIVDRNIDVTNVISSGLQGKILTTDLEEIVATTSYLPLLGKLGDPQDKSINSFIYWWTTNADYCCFEIKYVQHMQQFQID